MAKLTTQQIIKDIKEKLPIKYRPRKLIKQDAWKYNGTVYYSEYKAYSVALDEFELHKKAQHNNELLRMKIASNQNLHQRQAQFLNERQARRNKEFRENRKRVAFDMELRTYVTLAQKAYEDTEGTEFLSVLKGQHKHIKRLIKLKTVLSDKPEIKIPSLEDILE